jgi:hypothetical protein
MRKETWRRSGQSRDAALKRPRRGTGEPVLPIPPGLIDGGLALPLFSFGSC